MGFIQTTIGAVVVLFVALFALAIIVAFPQLLILLVLGAVLYVAYRVWIRPKTSSSTTTPIDLPKRATTTTSTSTQARATTTSTQAQTASYTPPRPLAPPRVITFDSAKGYEDWLRHWGNRVEIIDTATAGTEQRGFFGEKHKIIYTVTYRQLY